MIRTLQNVKRIHPRCGIEEFGRLVRQSVCDFEFFWKDDHRASLSVVESLFGSANVVGLAHGPGVALRSRKAIQRDRSDWCLLTVAVDGSPTVTQRGNHSTMIPGSVTILDCSAPMAVRFDRATKCIIIKLPRALVLQRVPDYESMCGFAYDCRVPTRQLWQSVTEHEVPMQKTVSYILRCCYIAWHAMEQGGGTAALLPPLTETEAALYWRVLSFIDGHLDSPELTPSQIARAHRISSGYLHRVFAKTGQSVAERIRGRRLENCRDAIRQAGNDSITEIAFRWGFVNVAHFSRAFKSRFGCSPRQFRRHASAAPNSRELVLRQSSNDLSPAYNSATVRYSESSTEGK